MSEIVTCPHCGKEGQSSPGMKRWHFNNCPDRPEDHEPNQEYSELIKEKPMEERTDQAFTDEDVRDVLKMNERQYIMAKTLADHFNTDLASFIRDTVIAVIISKSQG